MLTNITPYIRKCNLIIDIGAGYGGLIGLIKRVFPSIKCVLLDLPEANAIQTYYLSKSFPNRKILLFENIKDQARLDFGIENFDFAIVPGNLIAKIEDNSIDMFINTRSLMEMTQSVVSFYFKHIQRAIKEDGYFYCLNRYEKLTKFKYYPFDKYWEIAHNYLVFFHDFL